jgi:hypothetical protein
MIKDEIFLQQIIRFIDPKNKGFCLDIQTFYTRLEMKEIHIFDKDVQINEFSTTPDAMDSPK